MYCHTEYCVKVKLDKYVLWLFHSSIELKYHDLDLDQKVLCIYRFLPKYIKDFIDIHVMLQSKISCHCG